MNYDQLPKWQSHKTVGALQIASVSGPAPEPSDTAEPKITYSIAFVDAGFETIKVEPGLFARYMAKPGDYYVVYSDGYTSISPKQAFEDGYTKV